MDDNLSAVSMDSIASPHSPNKPEVFFIENEAVTKAKLLIKKKPQRGSASDPNNKEVYGLNLGLLRKWQGEKTEEILKSEHVKQEIAVAKVRGFLDAVCK